MIDDHDRKAAEALLGKAMLEGVRMIDEWAQKQLAELKVWQEPYIMSGGDLEAPEYRCKLGQHQAFMRLRSWISATIRLSTLDREVVSDD